MAKRSLVLRKVWTAHLATVRATGVANDDRRAAMLAVKQGFTAGGLPHPWTVLSSSDAATAGAGDRWLTAANLTWALAGGTAHSWIVLTHAVSGYQLCIDLLGTTTPASIEADFYASQSGGFAGGTTTNRPTAADEFAITTGQWIASAFGKPQQLRLIFLQSSDGKNFRAVWSSLRGVIWGAVMCIDELLDAREPAPVAWFWVGGTNVMSAQALASVANVRVYQSGTVLLCRYTAENINVATIPQPNVVSDFDGMYEAFPLGVISQQFPLRERLGSVPDLWILGGPQVAGDFVGTQRRGVTLNPLVLPWDGSATRPLE